MTRTVQQLIAAFENMSTGDSYEAPPSPISVKNLVNMFESNTKRPQVDEREVELIKDNKDNKPTDTAVQPDITRNDGTNSTINIERVPVRGEHTALQKVVGKRITMFEDLAFTEPIQDTVQSKFKEHREDGSRTVNQCHLTSEPKVAPSTSKLRRVSIMQSKGKFLSCSMLTLQHANRVIQKRSTSVSAKKIWRKTSSPRILMMIARGLRSYKKKSGNSKEIGFPSDPVQVRIPMWNEVDEAQNVQITLSVLAVSFK